MKQEKIKDKRYIRLANSERNQKHTEVSRTGKLLLSFIKDFERIARLLHDMVKKDQKQKWIEGQKDRKRVFKELKERFMREPVLAVLDLDKKMRIEVDTSDYTIEGVLSMKCEDRRWRPIVFLLKRQRETMRFITRRYWQ